MLATAGILPADRGPDVMDGAQAAIPIGQLFQPWTGPGVLIGSRHDPDTAGGDLPGVPDDAHPVEDIGSLQIPPALVVGYGAAVMKIQCPAAVAALNADETGHIGLHPDPGRPIRFRSITGVNRRPENPGADAGQTCRFRWTSLQLTCDPLFQIRFTGWNQFGRTRNFCPDGSVAAIQEDIGPVTKNHGP